MARQLNTNDVDDPAESIQEMLVADDGRLAAIRCVGPDKVGIGTQFIKLHRPSTLSIERETTRPMTFWHADEAKREANLLRWDDGTTLTITKGTIDSIDPDGYEDRKSHYGA